MAEEHRPTARLLLDRADGDCRPDWQEIPLGDAPVTIGRVGKLCDYTLKYGAVSGQHVLRAPFRDAGKTRLAIRQANMRRG